MKKIIASMLNKKFLIVLFAAMLYLSCSKADNGVEPKEDSTNTIVDKLGLLKSSGNKILDKNGNHVSIHGMSLFWSQWSSNFYNAKTVDWLYSDWKCTVVRAAMGVESGGYLTNHEAELTKITTVIDACIKNGIYVIVDWHDHNAQNHLEQAKQFFDVISERYGDKNNIIYEIYNEPLQVSWQNVVKPYSEEVIKVIRKNDPDNLIIVGNPTWSQDVDVAAKDPIVDPNITYALHFYTSTHGQSLRNKAVVAMQNNASVFVSEFGISEANGSGNINFAETNNWMNFVKDYKLSTCNWSAFDKNETSAALKPGANPQGGWSESSLTTSGVYNRNLIRELNKEVFKSIGIEY